MKMIWDLTNKCNLKCSHCGAIDLEQSKDLNNTEIKNVVNYISSFVKEVHLLGGEPLLHPEIFTILELLESNNIRTKIITNGQFTDEIAKRLIMSKADLILVSLDGLKEENDKVRGTGSWDKATMFLKSLIKYKKILGSNAKIGVNFVMNNINYSKVIEFIDFFVAVQVDVIQINSLIMQGNAIKNNLYINEELQLDVLENVSRYIVDQNINKVIVQNEFPIIAKYLNQKYGVKYELINTNCTALIDSIYCSPDGNIYACRKYKKKFINLLENKYLNWENDFNVFDEFLKETCILNIRTECSKCECKDICSSCPLTNEKHMPKICKLVNEKLDNYKIEHNRVFKLTKPYSIIQKNNEYFLYTPKIQTKTQYTEEGINILRFLEKPISVQDLSKHTMIEENILYAFLLQEKATGKIEEIKLS